MKIVNATTIGNLISAHLEGDNEKFLTYANFIADAYEEAGEDMKAGIIRKRLDGSYKNDSRVSLDGKECLCDNKMVPRLHVGDKVWATTSVANYSLGTYAEVLLEHPEEKKIQSITISKNGILYHVKNRTYCEADFGNTVFEFKDAAEEALEKERDITKENEN